MNESRTHYCHPSPLMGLFVNIIISHYKEGLRAILQISRSLFETGFSGFFNQTFPASFCESLIVVVVDYHLPHHYRPSGLLAISPMARLSKKYKHSERIETRHYSYLKTPAFPNEGAFSVEMLNL